MTDKWSDELEAEYVADITTRMVDDPLDIMRFLWLAGRTSGAREMKEKVKELIQEHYTFREVSGRYEMDVAALNRATEGLSHD